MAKCPVCGRKITKKEYNKISILMGLIGKIKSQLEYLFTGECPYCIYLKQKG